MVSFKFFIKKIVEKLGYKITVISKTATIKEVFPKDMEEEFKEISEKCISYTMTSRERMYSLYQAVKYVVSSKIPGDFVECGVWKGGSSMLMAYTLLKLGEINRKIYLYDTFTGMSKPTENDKTILNSESAIEAWRKYQREDYNEWCFAPLGEVKNNLALTGYPLSNLVFIKGRIEDTIPETTPATISILRLDTDWFESTYHELKYLYPLLSKGGVVIFDDYGHWTGSKEAPDKYFLENNVSILLNRIDYAGRLGIK